MLVHVLGTFEFAALIHAVYLSQIGAALIPRPILFTGAEAVN